MLEKLEKSKGMLTAFFADLAAYKDVAQAAARELPPAEHATINRKRFAGKFGHLESVERRLTFLQYILQHSSLVLNTEQVRNCAAFYAVCPVPWFVVSE